MLGAARVAAGVLLILGSLAFCRGDEAASRKNVLNGRATCPDQMPPADTRDQRSTDANYCRFKQIIFHLDPLITAKLKCPVWLEIAVNILSGPVAGSDLIQIRVLEPDHDSSRTAGALLRY